MTLPNFITLARLVSVPLIVWLIVIQNWTGATVVFVLAGISDGIDGLIAKRFGASSDLGAYLDPIADKALLVSLFLVLGFQAVLPPWLIILVVSRDILIVGGVILAWMLVNPIAMRPLWVSKFNTTAQIVLLALVLAEHAGIKSLSIAIWPMIITTAGLTVGSAGAYLAEWLRHMAGDEPRREEG
ncbi:CDP-alcohol phosphatidyltransferase family protein [Afifella marina]|uniref:CDP-diacylglycerol--glycerol-3-phosphate 3-phosphatidyltransferase n=1 Tax=Afifella marina DSM 2698 TaxID=1120955 RepID=A0A1G5NK58_AFIMA|nr:CDP-alcohol phosphatidyltransferase family protein [Afifella marina]MBK1623560.1 CDP-alcohol phosphatidyltransferase [Afifella marina DSM 2698]MBK1626553.1 CDP-alcohol phosphatidyltransferase [Afifella marina]MBK5916102.1 CDP-alcohol phosphatidyltransferase [Afifella marina]RAI21739.1 CDP-alcohol phosphatidyltransferase [Afifella marina DSM 2698]SCZ37141.1 CDP-diacylglycerol--glycerol-3-phosphate 3-phosphatidyltransferase [Afifella marina DSM 2698]